MIRGRSWGRRRRPSVPPAFDASSLSQGNGTRTWTHTIGAGGPKTLLAVLTHLNGGAGVPTPATINPGSAYDAATAVNLTLVDTQGAGGSNTGYVAMFKADNLAPGAYTIRLTTGESYSMGVGVSYTSVVSASAPVKAGGASAAPTTGAIAVSATEVLVSAFVTKNGPTVTSGTNRGGANHSSGYINTRILEGAGASPQTNSVTQTGSSYAIVSLKLSAA